MALRAEVLAAVRAAPTSWQAYERYLRAEWAALEGALAAQSSKDGSMGARIDETLNSLTAFMEERKDYVSGHMKWWELLWLSLASLALETKTALTSRFELRVIDSYCSLMLDDPSVSMKDLMRLCHDFEETLKTARAIIPNADTVQEYQAMYLLHCGRLQFRHANNPMIRPTARAATERKAGELLQRVFDAEFRPEAEGPLATLRRRRLLQAGAALLDAGQSHEPILSKLAAVERAELIANSYPLDQTVFFYARRKLKQRAADEVLLASLPASTQELNRPYALRFVSMLAAAWDPHLPFSVTEIQRSFWRAILGIGSLPEAELQSLRKQLDAYVPFDKSRAEAIGTPQSYAPMPSTEAPPQLSRVVSTEITAPRPVVNERVIAKHKQLVERIGKLRAFSKSFFSQPSAPTDTAWRTEFGTLHAPPIDLSTVVRPPIPVFSAAFVPATTLPVISVGTRTAPTLVPAPTAPQSAATPPLFPTLGTTSTVEKQAPVQAFALSNTAAAATSATSAFFPSGGTSSFSFPSLATSPFSTASSMSAFGAAPVSSLTSGVSPFSTTPAPSLTNSTSTSGAIPAGLFGTTPVPSFLNAPVSQTAMIGSKAVVAATTAAASSPAPSATSAFPAFPSGTSFFGATGTAPAVASSMSFPGAGTFGPPVTPSATMFGTPKPTTTQTTPTLSSSLSAVPSALPKSTDAALAASVPATPFPGSHFGQPKLTANASAITAAATSSTAPATVSAPLPALFGSKPAEIVALSSSTSAAPAPTPALRTSTSASASLSAPFSLKTSTPTTPAEIASPTAHASGPATPVAFAPLSGSLFGTAKPQAAGSSTNAVSTAFAAFSGGLFGANAAEAKPAALAHGSLTFPLPSSQSALDASISAATATPTFGSPVPSAAASAPPSTIEPSATTASVPASADAAVLSSARSIEDAPAAPPNLVVALGSAMKGLTSDLELVAKRNEEATGKKTVSAMDVVDFLKAAAKNPSSSFFNTSGSTAAGARPSVSPGFDFAATRTGALAPEESTTSASEPKPFAFNFAPIGATLTSASPSSAPASKPTTLRTPWQCPECDEQNSSKAEDCDNCGAGRPSATPVVSSSSFVLAPGFLSGAVTPAPSAPATTTASASLPSLANYSFATHSSGPASSANLFGSAFGSTSFPAIRETTAYKPAAASVAIDAAAPLFGGMKASAGPVSFAALVKSHADGKKSNSLAESKLDSQDKPMAEKESKDATAKPEEKKEVKKSETDLGDAKKPVEEKKADAKPVTAAAVAPVKLTSVMDSIKKEENATSVGTDSEGELGTPSTPADSKPETVTTPAYVAAPKQPAAAPEATSSAPTSSTTTAPTLSMSAFAIPPLAAPLGTSATFTFGSGISSFGTASIATAAATSTSASLATSSSPFPATPQFSATTTSSTSFAFPTLTPAPTFAFGSGASTSSLFTPPPTPKSETSVAAPATTVAPASTASSTLALSASASAGAPASTVADAKKEETPSIVAKPAAPTTAVTSSTASTPLPALFGSKPAETVTLSSSAPAVSFPPFSGGTFGVLKPPAEQSVEVDKKDTDGNSIAKTAAASASSVALSSTPAFVFPSLSPPLSSLSPTTASTSPSMGRSVLAASSSTVTPSKSISPSTSASAIPVSGFNFSSFGPTPSASTATSTAASAASFSLTRTASAPSSGLSPFSFAAPPAGGLFGAASLSATTAPAASTLSTVASITSTTSSVPPATLPTDAAPSSTQSAEMGKLIAPVNVSQPALTSSASGVATGPKAAATALASQYKDTPKPFAFGAPSSVSTSSTPAFSFPAPSSLTIGTASLTSPAFGAATAPALGKEPFSFGGSALAVPHGTTTPVFSFSAVAPAPSVKSPATSVAATDSTTKDAPKPALFGSSTASSSTPAPLNFAPASVTPVLPSAGSLMSSASSTASAPALSVSLLANPASTFAPVLTSSASDVAVAKPAAFSFSAPTSLTSSVGITSSATPAPFMFSAPNVSATQATPLESSASSASSAPAFVFAVPTVPASASATAPALRSSGSVALTTPKPAAASTLAAFTFAPTSLTNSVGSSASTTTPASFSFAPPISASKPAAFTFATPTLLTSSVGSPATSPASSAAPAFSFAPATPAAAVSSLTSSGRGVPAITSLDSSLSTAVAESGSVKDVPKPSVFMFGQPASSAPSSSSMPTSSLSFPAASAPASLSSSVGPVTGDVALSSSGSFPVTAALSTFAFGKPTVLDTTAASSASAKPAASTPFAFGGTTPAPSFSPLFSSPAFAVPAASSTLASSSSASSLEASTPTFVFPSAAPRTTPSLFSSAAFSVPPFSSSSSSIKPALAFSFSTPLPTNAAAAPVSSGAAPSSTTAPEAVSKPAALSFSSKVELPALGSSAKAPAFAFGSFTAPPPPASAFGSAFAGSGGGSSSSSKKKGRSHYATGGRDRDELENEDEDDEPREEREYGDTDEEGWNDPDFPDDEPAPVQRKIVTPHSRMKPSAAAATPEDGEGDAYWDEEGGEEGDEEGDEEEGGEEVDGGEEEEPLDEEDQGDEEDDEGNEEDDDEDDDDDDAEEEKGKGKILSRAVGLASKSPTKITSPPEPAPAPAFTFSLNPGPVTTLSFVKSAASSATSAPFAFGGQPATSSTTPVSTPLVSAPFTFNTAVALSLSTSATISSAPAVASTAASSASLASAPATTSAFALKLSFVPPMIPSKIDFNAPPPPPSTIFAPKVAAFTIGKGSDASLTEEEKRMKELEAHNKKIDQNRARSQIQKDDKDKDAKPV